jgi:RNA-binding protein
MNRGIKRLHGKITAYLFKALRSKQSSMKYTTKQIAHLRGLAHNLNPVVMIGNNGLTENVLKEIDLNLTAHELIKVQVAGDDREARKAMLNDIATQMSALAVHHIGKQLVFYRASDKVKESAKIVIPKL